MIRPKKSLGQNFLKSKKAAKRIVSCLKPTAADCILEIGPGTGILTEFLIESKATIYAVEIDYRLAGFLSQKYAWASNLHVIGEDILKFDMDSMDCNQKLKVIGNLPYHLTAPILQKLCDNHSKIDIAVLTVQREVAHRITAKVGSSDYSSLTIFLQNFCMAKKLFDLNPQQFHPPPNVTSTVIGLQFFEHPQIESGGHLRMRDLVRKLFGQRRKMVINSLMKSYSLTRGKAEEILESAGVKGSLRPQNLSLEMFYNLSKALNQNE